MNVLQTSTWFLFYKRSIFSVKTHIYEDEIAIELDTNILKTIIILAKNIMHLTLGVNRLGLIYAFVYRIFHRISKYHINWFLHDGESREINLHRPVCEEWFSCKQILVNFQTGRNSRVRAFRFLQHSVIEWLNIVYYQLRWSNHCRR